MKKDSYKNMILIIFSVLLFSLFIVSVSASHQGNSNNVNSSNVAYLIKKSIRAEPAILKAFSDKGLKVDLIEDRNIKNTDFSKYKFIFIGDDRLSNIEDVPKNMPVIVSSYYSELFGFLNRGSVSRTTSNDFVKIVESGNKIQVYNEDRFKIGGIVIPIYYLPNNLRNNEVESIATAVVGYGKEEVDVVSYLRKNSSCFFGIVESGYWTKDSEELFKKCIDFALGKRDKIHDIGISDVANGVNGIKIKDLESDKFLLNETLECNKKYTISFTTKNLGHYTEDLTISGSIANFTWEAEKNDLEQGKTTTTGSKTINVTFEPGIYDINILTEIELDEKLENNFRSREVEVICPNEVEKDNN